MNLKQSESGKEQKIHDVQLKYNCGWQWSMLYLAVETVENKREAFIVKTKFPLFQVWILHSWCQQTLNYPDPGIFTWSTWRHKQQASLFQRYLWWIIILSQQAYGYSLLNGTNFWNGYQVRSEGLTKSQPILRLLQFQPWKATIMFGC